jgi:hypothetical protein
VIAAEETERFKNSQHVHAPRRNIGHGRWFPDYNAPQFPNRLWTVHACRLDRLMGEAEPRSAGSTRQCEAAAERLRAERAS